MFMFRASRVAGVLAAAATGVVVLAGVASAHVTVQPSTAAAGSYTTLTFEVPNESSGASTVGLDVELPADAPIASVSIQPKPGWTYEVAHSKPATPLKTDDGEVTEIVSKISWKAAPGNPGIKPGEFDTFPISAGPLPAKAGSLAFKALQTYSDGTVVRWIDVAAPGAAEPEHPAPSLTLTAASGDEHGGSATGAATPGAEEMSAQATAPAQGTAGAAPASDTSDGTARAVGIAGLAVGVLGFGIGGLAFAATRRRPPAN
jgi:uncharacterized protein